MATGISLPPVPEDLYLESASNLDSVFLLLAIGVAVVSVLCAIPNLPKIRRKYRPPDEFCTPVKAESQSTEQLPWVTTAAKSGQRLAIAEGAPRELRNSLRRGGDPLPVEVSFEPDHSGPFAGFVLDRSQHGLRMELPRSVAAGAILHIRNTRYEDCAPWILVEVRRCQREGDQWIAGCKFVESLPWSVLLLFG